MWQYIGAFVYVFFPLAGVLLYLLIGPMPTALKGYAQSLADKILYAPIQIARFTISLFRIIFIIATLTVVSACPRPGGRAGVARTHARLKFSSHFVMWSCATLPAGAYYTSARAHERYEQLASTHDR